MDFDWSTDPESETWIRALRNTKVDPKAWDALVGQAPTSLNVDDRRGEQMPWLNAQASRLLARVKSSPMFKLRIDPPVWSNDTLSKSLGYNDIK